MELRRVSQKFIEGDEASNVAARDGAVEKNKHIGVLGAHHDRH